MKKIAIFNVGGALSSYVEFDNKKILIDLGSNSDFSPVENFLLPLSEKGKFTLGKQPINQGKYIIDQLFLSHLDKDHISDYVKFKENFWPDLMTCPNDNTNQDDALKVNRDLLGEENDVRNIILEDMGNRVTIDSRYPRMNPSKPLISIIDEVAIFYIKPKVCENIEDLMPGYANNISLVLFFQVGNKSVLFPGDMLKKGMSYLIDNDKEFNELLKNIGVDYLIAPHHGLQTSFSELLFQTMDNNKTRLNIISEKIREEESDENRSDVDTRYYSSDYSTGENSLEQKAVKTSMGHIVIDFENDETEVKQYQDIIDVINEFINN